MQIFKTEHIYDVTVSIPDDTPSTVLTGDDEELLTVTRSSDMTADTGEFSPDTSSPMTREIIMSRPSLTITPVYPGTQSSRHMTPPPVTVQVQVGRGP